jgi:hypothetical protein
MSDEWFGDIEEVEPGTGLRSKDLYNRTCLIRPVELRERQGEDGMYQYWATDVVILNQAGVEDHAREVHIGWSNMLEPMGRYVGTWRVVKAVQKGTAWVFSSSQVDSKMRDVAKGLGAEVAGLFPKVKQAVPERPDPGVAEDGTEPF